MPCRASIAFLRIRTHLVPIFGYFSFLLQRINSKFRRPDFTGTPAGGVTTSPDTFPRVCRYKIYVCNLPLSKNSCANDWYSLKNLVSRYVWKSRFWVISQSIQKLSSFPPTWPMVLSMSSIMPKGFEIRWFGLELRLANWWFWKRTPKSDPQGRLGP